MSEKTAREKRRSSRPQRSTQSEDLPAPANTTKPYTLSMVDSIASRFLWQIRPKPLMRRLFLCALVGPTYCFFLKPIADLPLADKMPWILGSAVAGIILYTAVTTIISLLVGIVTFAIKKSQFTDVVLYWDDKRIEWVSPVYTNKYVWNKFKAHFIAKTVTILALQGTIVSVPKRAFKNENDWESFNKIAQEKAVGFRIGIPAK